MKNDLDEMQKLVDELRATAEALWWFVLLAGIAAVIWFIIN